MIVLVKINKNKREVYLFYFFESNQIFFWETKKKKRIEFYSIGWWKWFYFRLKFVRIWKLKKKDQIVIDLFCALCFLGLVFCGCVFFWSSSLDFVLFHILQKFPKTIQHFKTKLIDFQKKKKRKKFFWVGIESIKFGLDCIFFHSFDCLQLRFRLSDQTRTLIEPKCIQIRLNG